MGSGKRSHESEAFYLYRPTYKDRKTGNRRHQKTWWVKFSIDGRDYFRSCGTRDRRAASMSAADIVKKEELAARGIVDPFEKYRKLPIAEHIAGFKATLAARDITDRYRRYQLGYLAAFMDATAGF